MHPSADKIEEIRTICRLHASPTGSRENLVDLPSRLSQDSGFRADLSDIVRSLQRSSFHLPDVLDLFVLAVGGETSPRFSRELSEPLNQIGAFLSSVGRWPDTDNRPVLAPGEIPENIEKFSRPAPRVMPVQSNGPSSPPQSPAPSAAPTPASPPSPPPARYAGPAAIPNPAQPPSAAPLQKNPVQLGSQLSVPSPAGASGPQQPRPVRLFEVSSRRPPVPSISAAESPSPEIPQGPAPVNPIQSPPIQSPPSLPVANLPVAAAAASQPSSASGENAILTPDQSAAVSNPSFDITQALSRLERGTLELRAHLDSIDQRISRMEPLLESGTPPDLPMPPANPAGTPAQDLPTLVHRDSPSRDSPSRDFPPRAALRPDPLPADSPSIQPARTHWPRPEPVRSEGTPKSQSAPVPSIQTDLTTPEAAGTVNTAGIPEQPRSASAAAEKSLEPPPIVPRFSRFSRDSDFAGDTVTEPGQAGNALESPISASVSNPGSSDSRGDLHSIVRADEPRPMKLPRGFFGTIPEPDENTVDLPPDPPRSRRRLLLIVGLVLLVCAIVAVLLYLQNSAADGSQTPNSSSITSGPAPRASVYPTPATLPGGASRSSSNQRANAANGRVLSPRSSAQQGVASSDPGSSGGFRPAANFVPASVMEGHLVAAPPPNLSHAPASSGTQAIVVMEVNISNSGQVEDVYVLGGNPALRPAAVEAVRNWRYKPYRLNGTPVEVRTIVRVDFSERRSQPAAAGAPFPG